MDATLTPDNQLYCAAPLCPDLFNSIFYTSTQNTLRKIALCAKKMSTKLQFWHQIPPISIQSCLCGMPGTLHLGARQHSLKQRTIVFFLFLQSQHGRKISEQFVCVLPAGCQVSGPWDSADLDDLSELVQDLRLCSQGLNKLDRQSLKQSWDKSRHAEGHFIDRNSRCLLSAAASS